MEPIILMPFLLVMLSIAVILCALIGKSAFKDLIIFIGGIFLCSYIWMLINTGVEHYNKVAFPALYSLYYGLLCFIICSGSLRFIKSKVVFCVVSWAVVIFFLIIKFVSLKNSHLTSLEGGHYLYVDGKMTIMGFLQYIQNPLWLMAVCSTLLLLEFFKNRHIKN